MKCKVIFNRKRLCCGVIRGHIKGGEVSYHHPYIPNVETNEGKSFTSVDLSAENLAKANCVVLTTNHTNLDVEFIKEHAKLIVDMRNMIKEGNGKVVKL